MTNRGYIPVPRDSVNDPNVLLTFANRINDCQSGRLNVTLDVEVDLTTGSATFTDPRISVYSFIQPMVISTSAAISLNDVVFEVETGTATMRFTPGSTTQTIRFLIIG